MAALGDEVRQACLLALRAGIRADLPGAVERLADELAGPVARLERRDAAEAGVGWCVRVAWIAGDRDVGRRVLDELAIANLRAPADQLDHQQAGCDEPLAVAVAARVVDFHAGLVEVLDLPQAAGRLDVSLSAR